MGVWDEPVVAIRLSASGPQGDVSIIWEDPIGVRISTGSVKLEGGWFVSFHKPKLERPIRPGVWSVKLEMGHGALLMQIKFLIVPLTHDNELPLKSPRDTNAARLSKSGINFNKDKYEIWYRNATKSGTELDEWLDELVSGYWNISGICRTELGGGGGRGGRGSDAHGGSEKCNSWIPDCRLSKWSTFSKDPKSEIGEVQANGRLR